MTPPLVVYTFGTPIALILERNFIDFRASYSAAWGLAPELVCAGCGSRIADDAHSPRCSE